MKHINNLGFI